MSDKTEPWGTAFKEQSEEDAWREYWEVWSGRLKKDSKYCLGIQKP